MLRITVSKHFIIRGILVIGLLGCCTATFTPFAAFGDTLAQQLTKQGKTMLEADHPDIAVKLFGQAIQLDPKSADAYDGRGNAERLQLAEVQYYVGMKRLLAGNRSGAISAFKQCIAVGDIGITEMVYSKWELKRLGVE